jgi:hypothetical protein
MAKVYVLSLNDSPIGAYASRDLAEEAAEYHKTHCPHETNQMWYYHVRPFEVNDPARL